MKYFKTINEIDVYTFFKIIDNTNPQFLLKKYNDEKAKKLTDNQKAILNETFNKILLEFNAKNVTSKSLRSIKAKAMIDYMESRYDVTTSILNLYESTNEVVVLFALKELGWGFDSEGNIDKQLNSITKKMVGLKMQIKIRKVRYDSEFNKLKKNKDDEDKKWLDIIDREALYLERTLDLKHSINVNKTKLIRWCNLLALAKQIKPIDG